MGLILLNYTFERSLSDYLIQKAPHLRGFLLVTASGFAAGRMM
jgi:hypothetical protein